MSPPSQILQQRSIDHAEIRTEQLQTALTSRVVLGAITSHRTS
jgi:hypothetical protein